MDFGCGCALGFRVLERVEAENDMNRPRLFLLLMALVALSWYGVVVAGWASGAIVEQDGCRCCT